jgi:hypothetical protein
MEDLEIIGIIFGELFGLTDGGVPIPGGDAFGLAFVQCNTINQAELVKIPKVRELAEMGFRPVTVVRANPRNWCEYSLYMLEGIQGERRERVEMLAPMLMNEQIEGWLKSKYGDNSDAVKEWKSAIARQNRK